MNTITIYFPGASRRARRDMQKAPGGSACLLNDRTGDTCCVDRATAIENGFQASTPLTFAKDFAVVEITYPLALHEDLLGTGDISLTEENDLGFRTWQLTAHACARLNAEAAFDMEVFPVVRDNAAASN